MSGSGETRRRVRGERAPPRGGTPLVGLPFLPHGHHLCSGLTRSAGLSPGPGGGDAPHVARLRPVCAALHRGAAVERERTAAAVPARIPAAAARGARAPGAAARAAAAGAAATAGT